MKVKIGKKFIKVETINGFLNRFKCMKFNLNIIETGYCFPKKKYLSTYFFCQRIDVVMTDKENKIIYMRENMPSEKRIFWKKNVYYTYILPLNSCNKLDIGKNLIIKE